MPDPLAIAYPTGVGGYPYSTGYCDVNGVSARVNAGTWDPSSPAAAPGVAQVVNWLAEGTANIDAALATRGYYVPLTPIAGWVAPAGMPTYQGIGLGAWLMLRHICAAYAVHFVESSRHTGSGRGEDLNAVHWMTIFNDFITRVETAADNLATFGVGGIFAPDIDPAHGADTGSIGTVLSDTSLTEGPIFGRRTNWGGGYERLPPPSNTPWGS